MIRTEYSILLKRCYNQLVRCDMYVHMIAACCKEDTVFISRYKTMLAYAFNVYSNAKPLDVKNYACFKRYLHDFRNNAYLPEESIWIDYLLKCAEKINKEKKEV